MWEWTSGIINGGQQPGVSGETTYSGKEWNQGSLVFNGFPNSARPNYGTPAASSWSSAQGTGHRAILVESGRNESACLYAGRRMEQCKFLRSVWIGLRQSTKRRGRAARVLRRQVVEWRTAGISSQSAPVTTTYPLKHGTNEYLNINGIGWATGRVQIPVVLMLTTPVSAAWPLASTPHYSNCASATPPQKSPLFPSKYKEVRGFSASRYRHLATNWQHSLKF